MNEHGVSADTAPNWEHCRLPKSTVYLAGKIAKDDWRTKLFGKRFGGVFEEEDLFNPDLRIELEGCFSYVGPFFVACDHGCAHGRATLGAAGGCGVEGMRLDDWHQKIFDINRHRLSMAEVVFAYINETDCHGTLIELGLAHAQRKSIVVAFGPDIVPDELWMARACADRIFSGPLKAVWHLFKSEFGGPLRFSSYPTNTKSSDARAAP